MSEMSWILGIDFNDIDAQVSWVQKGKEEPITMEINPGEEQYQFPTCLCKKEAADTWVFGQKAKRQKVMGEGVFADRLLERCYNNKPLEAEGVVYEPIWLLSEYFLQFFLMIKRRLPKGKISRVVFTIPGADSRAEQIIKEAIKQTDIQEESVYVAGHDESFAYYVRMMPKELQYHNSMLFTFRDKKFHCMELVSEKKGSREYLSTKNYTSEALIEREDFYPEEEMSYEEYLDKQLHEFAKSCIEKKLITAIYLVSDFFDGEWMKASLTALCKGRKAFLGKNLFTRGACYMAIEKEKAFSEKNWIFAGPDTILHSLGIRLRVKGQETLYELAMPGQKWYDEKRCFDIILEQEEGLEFVIHNIQGEEREEKIYLEELPHHLSGTLRLQIKVEMLSVRQCQLMIQDVGFGMISPPADYCKKIQIEL